MVVGKLFIPFGKVTFQGRTVKLREGIRLEWASLGSWWKFKLSQLQNHGGTRVSMEVIVTIVSKLGYNLRGRNQPTYIGVK